MILSDKTIDRLGLAFEHAAAPIESPNMTIGALIVSIGAPIVAFGALIVAIERSNVAIQRSGESFERSNVAI